MAEYDRYENAIERWTDPDGTLCFSLPSPTGVGEMLIVGNTAYIPRSRQVLQFTAPDELVTALREGRDDDVAGKWEFQAIDDTVRRLVNGDMDAR